MSVGGFLKSISISFVFFTFKSRELSLHQLQDVGPDVRLGLNCNMGVLTIKQDHDVDGGLDCNMGVLTIKWDPDVDGVLTVTWGS